MADNPSEVEGNNVDNAKSVTKPQKGITKGDLQYKI